MKWTQTYIPTLREKQTDAELISHQLLLRGGYIRKLAAGVYLYLPLMQRVIDKFSHIVREEMNRAGALEITMSVLCPAEVWQKSGRYGIVGKEQMRMKDRHQHEMVMCGTHEETVTQLVAGEVRSYKQLPLNLYQIQVKFRDEIRPRFGLMRGREFVMKDAYTFDATDESFARSYQGMVDAYFRVFSRAGLDVLKVESDTGAMGGKAAHEFMLLVDTNAGEETIISCPSCGYAANVEKAISTPKPVTLDREIAQPAMISTPKASTIEQVTAFLKVDASRLVKTLIYMADTRPVAALVRGDRELNEVKLKNAIGAIELEMATPEQVQQATGAPVGYAGPVGLNDVEIIADPMVVALVNMVVGANKFEQHMTGVNHGRDFTAQRVADISNVQAGDSCPLCKSELIAKKGIEVGNTFMLGTKYSIPLEATFLDADGKEQPMLMGSYGIGITRTCQAALEKGHDEKGIIWPMAIAPYHVELIPLNIDKESQRTVADRLYVDLTAAGIEVLYDNRSDRAGVKLNDADLIGIPIRLQIGDKGLANQQVELVQRSGLVMELVEISQAVARVKDMIAAGLR